MNPTKKPPTKALLRFGVFVVLIAGVFLLARTTSLGDYLTQERLVDTLDHLRRSWWAPGALILLYVVLAPLGVPVTPLILAGGAVYGTFLGALINLVGLVLGGVASFLLARGLARDLVVHVLGERQKRINRYLRRQGFWTLVRLRFIPLPFALANFGAALAGVRLSLFCASTILAFIPLMLVSSYLASAFVQAADGQRLKHVAQLLAAMAFFLCLSFLPTAWIGWQRRRRYRRLTEARRSFPSRS